MCFPGRSRFCLLCLLLYTWSPLAETTPAAAPDDTEGATYALLNQSAVDSGAGDQDVYQIQEVDSTEVLDKDYHINRLMEEYGNGTVMDFEGFEHLLHKLGLGKIVIFDHSVKCHKSSNSSGFKTFHKSHNHTLVLAEDSLCEDGEEMVDVHHHEHGESEAHVDDHGDHDHEDHDHSDHKDKESDTHTDVHGDPDQHTHDHEHVEGDGDTHAHTHSETETSDTHSHEHNEGDGDTHAHTHADGSDTHSHEHEVGEGDLPTDNAQVIDNDGVQTAAGQAQDDTNTPTSHSKRDIPSEDKCLPATTFLYLSNSKALQYVTAETFRDLCPSLVYQVSHDMCHDHHTHQARSHSNNQVGGDDLHNHDDHLGHGHGEKNVVREGGLSGVPAKVWGYSTIAVVIISLVGLLGVAVIPIMQKVFYNHMLQFLVALAVGALSGDALLHLLPHAISGGHGDEGGGHGHSNEEDHSGPVYKGLCGLIGIFFFFVIERILTIFTELKRRKKQSRNRKIAGDEHLAAVGEKLAADCDEMMMSVHPNKALRGYADEAHSEHCMISFEPQSISHQHGTHKHKNSHAHNNSHSEEAEPEEQIDMLSRSNSHAHGHSHTHCIDGAPNSIAAIAWMVILGDGIHNFSDGLAIGAAFSNSITGGFSTSVAVFCHELPHEIGDFAMLLRAGMAPKQAIIYNCLSSVLCFIGMLIGVAIGNIENASLWIFAVVGGMFLYIALVDMLPEMSSVEPKRGENPFCHLALQLGGMLIGAGIMLIIALYEESLKSVFD